MATAGRRLGPHLVWNYAFRGLEFFKPDHTQTTLQTRATSFHAELPHKKMPSNPPNHSQQLPCRAIPPKHRNHAGHNLSIACRSCRMAPSKPCKPFPAASMLSCPIYKPYHAASNVFTTFRNCWMTPSKPFPAVPCWATPYKLRLQTPKPPRRSQQCYSVFRKLPDGARLRASYLRPPERLWHARCAKHCLKSLCIRAPGLYFGNFGPESGQGSGPLLWPSWAWIWARLQASYLRPPEMLWHARYAKHLSYYIAFFQYILKSCRAL